MLNIHSFIHSKGGNQQIKKKTNLIYFCSYTIVAAHSLQEGADDSIWLFDGLAGRLGLWDASGARLFWFNAVPIETSYGVCGLDVIVPPTAWLADQ